MTDPTIATAAPLDVVVVDDDPEQRAIFKRYLDGLGVSCAAAADAGTAMDLVERRMPRIVVTDINLQGMDGIGFAKWISQQERRPLVILVTGYPDRALAASAARVPVYAVIEKPMPLRVLGQHVLAALERAA